MLKFKNYIFLVILGLFFHIDSNAQIDKTFWFAVPDASPLDGWNVASNSFFRVGTFGKAATVTITQPASGGAVLAVQTIPANSSYSFSLNSIFSTLVAAGDDIIVNKGVLISSTEIISVYFDSGVGNVNPDLFSLKGSNGLGNDFIVTAGNFPTGYRTRHEAYVIAPEDNTTITITPSVNILNHNAGVAYTKLLNRGQVYIITSEYTAPPANPTITAAQKLGGTIIQSDKPVAVVHADDLISVPNGGCGDLNGDQLIPTRLAGKEYVLMPGSLTGMAPNNASDYIFIYPIKDGVTITVNGTSAGTFNRGQFHRIDNNGSAKYITSSDSVLVYQIAGTTCEVGGAVIPALTCTGSQSVGIVRNNTLDFKLSILAKQADIGAFTFKKSSGIIPGVIPASAFSAVGASGWYAASIDLNISNPIVNGEGAIISNSLGVFHLGVTSNTGGGTAFGYFSNFGSVSGEIQNAGTTVCENGKARLEVSIPGGASSYQWSRNGVILPEFTGDSVLTCRSGNFKVVATTNSGCNGTFEFPLSFSRCRYTCVENLKVSLNGKCQDTLALTEAVLPSDCLEAPDYFLVVNDANPSNGAVIDGISPASGWTYGVFLNLDNGGTELICQGRVVVTDDLGPIFTPEQKAAWGTIDTVVTWADNLDEVLNVPSSWWGNSIGYQLPPTYDGANKYYMGRPYMTDSCEINNCGS